MKENKERVYSERELQRSAMVDAQTAELAQKGFVREDVIISISWANTMAIVWTIPFVIVFGALFIAKNGFICDFGDWGLLLMCAALFVCIPVHEGLHGLTWGILAPGHFKSIEFGIMKDSKTPYCTCLEPLKKGAYIVGSMMPFLVLGIIPSIVGVLNGSLLVLLFGIFMIAGAGGDLTVIWKMLRYQTDASDVIIMDHPSECGFIVFQKG